MHLAPSTAWVWLIACAVVILFFPLAAQFGNLKGKLSSFRTWVWAIALLGIVTAGFIPFTFDTDIANFEVQPFIFFITGTLLGVLFLGEFHRMNAQKKLEHPQRVHAKRHTRYSKAVEHLAYPNPAVRASAISTLAGLVDEWLADEQLSVEARQKEGQVVVNALCAYVRSPFARAFKAEAFESDTPPANYAGDFATDLAAFRGEQDVRRSIFVEMSKRSSTFTKNDKGEIIETVPGPWSDFDFDFSRAPIFYPLSSLTIEKGNFSSAKFYSNADFSWATFTQTANFSEATFTQTANFNGAKFTQTANFREATFAQNADFRGAKFTQNADFRGAKFTQTANFNWAKFTQTADFRGAKFTQTANFNGAKFTQNADFAGAKFTQNADFAGATFTQTADFRGATFTQTADFRGAKFTQTANFSKATFTQTANFSKATFTQTAGFGRATFTQTADFSGATFTQNANFTWATFTQNANFSEATFSASSPKFMETYEVLRMTFRARFATLPKNQRADIFTVSEDSFPILLGEAELGDGVKHHIPVGTVLFDPDSWDEEKQEYTHVSEPAKPLENSDTEEEKPAG